ncbi:SAM-dependent methyltransferase [Acrocarpospora catenulata]|uniref:SAM-dependent methyltransferase n=1 Tax=Acrocarpospora catenulata TaxID=2836182 RepID=UPI001BD97CF9|nr:SAM-dependent methyltransferase [Acrocarpospora catenulata]
MNAPKIDTSVPHPARVYDYWLGGKDNYAADRKVAEAVIASTPGVVLGARENRAFLGRAVRYLSEQGVSQFLDIGTGIPTAGNTHEIAQSINPAARVAYVDNDTIVMVHARALLNSTPEGRTTYIEADLREPESILAHPDVLHVLDFSQPIGVIIVGTLMHIRNEDDPWGAVKQFTDATCPGSYLAITHLTADFAPEAMGALARSYNTGPLQMTNRTAEEVNRFFDGFELVEPGLVWASRWHPDKPIPADAVPGAYGAVGRKL